MKNTNESRIETIEAMLQNNPTDCFLRHALGLELQKKGDLAGAIKAFKQVVEQDENYVGTYYHLALALVHGHRAEAKKVFEKGLQIAKAVQDKHAENELRMVYEEEFDDDEV